MPDISADKFQHYSLYYGHEGHCADGEILSNLKISSFENVVQTCDANPNCTFISYYFEANSAKLCSGREFTYKSSIYVDAVVSGDKRGCESFDTKVARIFHRQNKLPTCSDKGKRLPILANSETNENIFDLLFIQEDGSLLDVARNRICASSGELYTEPGLESMKAECLWEHLPEGNFLHVSSRSLLLGGILNLKNKRLITKADCLCHNVQSNIVIGPWCENEDCIWLPEIGPCLLRNKQNEGVCFQRKVSEWNKEVAFSADDDCVCQSAKFLSRNSSACEHEACQWENLGLDKIKNIETKTEMVLQSSVRGINIVSKPAMCLCRNRKQGLVVIPCTTGGADCEWISGEYPLELDPVYQNAFVVSNTRQPCVVQLQPNLVTSSLNEATQLCYEEPMCTSIAFNKLEGQTILCSGQYQEPDFSIEQDNWVFAIQNGCEDVDDRVLVDELYKSNALNCRARLKKRCECPDGMTPVIPCTLEKDMVCTDCPSGHCPILSAKSYPIVVNDFPELYAQGFRAFNPSIVFTNTNQFITFRLSNGTWCDGFPVRASLFVTKAIVCDLKDRQASNCRFLDAKVNQLLESDSFESPVVLGFEDARSFIFAGRFYWIGTVSLLKRTSQLSNLHSTTIGLVEADPLTGKVVRSYAIPRADKFRRVIQKNWMPLIKNRSLYFVTSVSPMTIFKVNFNTTGSNPSIDLDLHQMTTVRNIFQGTHGGTPFLRYGTDWLAVVHQHIAYPVGPVYIHYILQLSSEDDEFKVKWFSPGFRLPQSNKGSSVDGIQFISALRLDGDTLELYYGVSDCSSNVAMLPGFKQILRDRNLPFLNTTVMDLRTRRKVRWEGPASDGSGFADVVRQFSRYFSKSTFKFQIVDLSPDHRIIFKNQQEIASSLITNNDEYYDRPDITIRMTWPPKFEKAHSKYVIIYLPWQFLNIPVGWIKEIYSNVDELWVSSNSTVDMFVTAGLSRDKINIITHGINPDNCRQTTSYASIKKGFKFLYVGEISKEAGVDLLVEAYLQEFSASNDVALLLYITQGDEDLYDSVLLSAKDKKFPKIHLVPSRLSDEDISLLYRNADVYVHPAKGDYGLSTLEAMTCSLALVAPDRQTNMTQFRQILRSAFLAKPANPRMIQQDAVIATKQARKKAAEFAEKRIMEVLHPFQSP